MNPERRPPESSLAILLIEDSPSDALLVREHLMEAYGARLELEEVGSLAEALDRLRTRRFDALLCDLGLPDSGGFDTFHALHSAAREAAVVVLTGLADEELAFRAVQAGAQDYLSKATLDGNLLPRTLRYAIERKRAEESVRRARDELERIVEARTAALSRANQALRESEARFRAMADSTPFMMWLADPDGTCTYFNQAWLAFTGHALEEELCRGWTTTVHPEDLKRCLDGYGQAFAARQPFKLEYRMKRRDDVYRWLLETGGPLYEEDGGFAGYVGGCLDITDRKGAEDQVRLAARQLEFLASFDTLTDLPNRRFFYARLKHVLARAARHPCEFAVMLIDLDNFKVINDTLGHDHGDHLLQTVAHKLRECVRQEDTLARLGGDEFAVLFENLDGMQPVLRTAERVVQALAGPLCLEAHEAPVTASLGFSVFPRDGQDAPALMKNADMAMYRAKALGKNRYQFFTAEMQQEAMERMAMENGLRRGLERREFELAYQPIVEIASGATVGMEGLLRWRSQEFSGIGPGRFIPIAEETGLIVPLGTFVIEAACGQLRAWQRAGRTGVRLAVNLSPRQFRQPEFARLIKGICRKAGILAAELELELTEGAVMEDADRAAEVLYQIKGMGISIAIDDFGTGYSSLAYLRRFPIDRLKIDRTFVRDVVTDRDAGEITKTIIAMAHALKLKTVAEGVETAEQLAFLRTHGCDEAQGYYFAAPSLMGLDYPDASMRPVPA